MKLGNRLAYIFSHAVALEQSGRLRSTVYCIGRKVFILNQDHTVLLRFLLRKVDKLRFDSPVSFMANDYDSNQVENRDGRICFIQSSSSFERVKSCKTPSLTPEEVEELYRAYELEEENKVTLHRDVLGLLDESLSHIEFASEEGKLKVTQRNIYSGSVIELKRKRATGLGIQEEEELGEFSPVGLRTNDFMALYSFVDSFSFRFQKGGYIWAQSNDQLMPMRALISKCKYDELGGIDRGRKKPKERGS